MATFRNGQYTGKGVSIGDVRVGAHASNGPLQYHVADSIGGVLVNPFISAGLGGVVQRDSCMPYGGTGEYTHTLDGAGTIALAASGLLLTTANSSGNKTLI